MRLSMVALVFALGAASGFAAPSPKPAAPPSPQSGKAAVADDAVSAKYTLESLNKQLTEMGFKTSVEGEQITVTIKRGEDENLVGFYFDDHLLWLSCNLVSSTKNLDKVPATAYWKLLQANLEDPPTHFSIDTERHDVNAYRPMSKRVLTAQELNRVLTDFDSFLVKTQKLYGPDIFTPGDDAAAETKGESK